MIGPHEAHAISLCTEPTRLEGLDEGPQQDANGVALPQQLDETSRPEQPQETQVDQLVLGEKRDAVRNCK